MNNETCYMCHQVAAISEYMLPRHLFFSEQGLFDKVEDYRNSMVYVPSCIEHNHDKVLDDEHLASSVLMSMGKREMPLISILNKSIVKEVDRHELSQERVIASLEKRVRGLFYDHFHDKFLDKISLFSSCIPGQDSDLNISLKVCEEILDKVKIEKETIELGAVPDIFSYTFVELGVREIALDMLFHQELRVIAILQKE
ncbi:hypothetical protein [Ignatzschineria sp. LJL83]